MQHLIIPKPYNLNTVATQIRGSLRVVFSAIWQIMLTAVKFDGYFFGRTVEIKNIRTNTVLPEKLKPMKLAVPHPFPESLFGSGLPTAQFAAAVFQVWIVFQEVHKLVTPP